MTSESGVDYSLYLTSAEGRLGLLNLLSPPEQAILRVALEYVMAQIREGTISVYQRADSIIFDLPCPLEEPQWWNAFVLLRTNKTNLLRVLFDGNVGLIPVILLNLINKTATQVEETMPSQSDPAVASVTTEPTATHLSVDIPETSVPCAISESVSQEREDYRLRLEYWCSVLQSIPSVVYTRWTPGIKTTTDRPIEHAGIYTGYQYAWPTHNADSSQALDYLFSPTHLLTQAIGGHEGITHKGTGMILITDYVQKGRVHDSEGRTIVRDTLDRIIQESGCVCSIAAPQGADQTGRAGIIFQSLFVLTRSQCEALIVDLRKYSTLAWDLLLRTRPGLFDDSGKNSTFLRIIKPNQWVFYDLRNLDNIGLDPSLVQAAKTGQYDHGSINRYPTPTFSTETI